MPKTFYRHMGNKIKIIREDGTTGFVSKKTAESHDFKNLGFKVVNDPVKPEVRKFPPIVTAEPPKDEEPIADPATPPNEPINVEAPKKKGRPAGSKNKQD